MPLNDDEIDMLKREHSRLLEGLRDTEDDPQRILQVLSDGTIAKWEYKRVVMHYPHGFNAQTITSDSGWELVSVILAKDGLEIGYFKREVKDAV